jgi:hypothetical protein
MVSGKLHDIDEELQIASEDIADNSGQSGSPSKRTFPKHGSIYRPSSIRGAFQASKIFSIPSLTGRRENHGPTSPDLESNSLLQEAGFEKRPLSLPVKPLSTRVESYILDSDDVFSSPSSYGSKAIMARLSSTNQAPLFKPQIGSSGFTTYRDDLGIHHGPGFTDSPRPKGFCIVEEEPSPRLLSRSKLSDTKGGGSRALPQKPGTVSPTKNSSWKSYLPSPFGTTNEEDKFTALPSSIPRRRDLKRTNTETSVMSRRNIPLPKSPPQIISPPLQSQLFFTSPSQNILNAQPPSRHSGPSFTARSRDRGTPPRVPSKSEYQVRLRERRLSEPSSRQAVSDRPQGYKHHHSETGMGSSNTRTPRQRYEARAKALDRVEEIISKSYSQQLDKIHAKG